MTTHTLSIALAVLATPALGGTVARHSVTHTAQIAQEQMLDADTLGALAVGQRVLLDNFPLDDGSSLDLDLERFTVLRPDSRTIIVDEQGVEHDAGDLGVVLLKGSVAGDPGSRVYVSTSPYGINGFIKTKDTTYSISTGPSGADFGHDLGLTVCDAALIPSEDGPERPCAVIPSADALNKLAIAGLAPDGYADRRVRATRETELAIETDYEYTANIFGGNANAASAYIQTLIGGITLIYENDLDVHLTVVYSRVFSANNDPYPGNDDSNRLDHFMAEWDANMEGVHRDAAHMFTGLSPSWGGIAYVSALCFNEDNGEPTSYDYGCSAYLNGFFPSPLTDHNSDNWDLVVCAHELGHNHGTGHTHDIDWYNPIIDGCGLGDCSAPYGGTIMSYCHTCSGGLSNIVLNFHPRVIDTMAYFIDNFAPCLTAPAGGACSPCDLDANGTLNLDDINTFAAAFVSSDLAADLDNNGTLNLDDINTFASCFTTGCP